MSDLSVIIINYNTRQLLLDCLHSVEETTAGMSVEIWVVDNASTDGSVDAVRSSFPRVHLVVNNANLGFAKANNQILPQANGDVIVLLNPDTLVWPGAFTYIEQAFESDATTGVVGPQLLNSDGTVQPSCGRFASAWTEFIFQFFLFKVIPSPFPVGRAIHPLQRNQQNKKHEVDWVSGACLAIGKGVIERIGLLDETYFMYGEDMEWCWRARRAGYKVYCEPSAKVVHFLRKSSNMDYKTWIERYTKGELRFIDHTRPAVHRLLFGLMISLGSLLRIGLWEIYGFLNSRRKNEAHQRILGYRNAFISGCRAVLGKQM